MAFLDSGVENDLGFADPNLQLFFEGRFWQETDQTVCNISLLHLVFESDTTQQGFAIQPTQSMLVRFILMSLIHIYNYPLIDPHHLESSHDVEVLKRGIKANNYKLLVSRPSQRKIPCRWAAIIYYFVKNYYHIKGKCYIYS